MSETVEEANDFLSAIINCFEENVSLPFPQSRFRTY